MNLRALLLQETYPVIYSKATTTQIGQAALIKYQALQLKPQMSFRNRIVVSSLLRVRARPPCHQLHINSRKA